MPKADRATVASLFLRYVLPVSLLLAVRTAVALIGFFGPGGGSGYASLR